MAAAHITQVGPSRKGIGLRGLCRALGWHSYREEKGLGLQGTLARRTAPHRPRQKFGISPTHPRRCTAAPHRAAPRRRTAAPPQRRSAAAPQRRSAAAPQRRTAAALGKSSPSPPHIEFTPLTLRHAACTNERHAQMYAFRGMQKETRFAACTNERVTRHAQMNASRDMHK